jgi:protease IV
MKKLLFLILALIVVAVLLATAVTYLGDRQPTALAASDVVLRLRLAQPVLDYAPAPALPFLASRAGASLIDIYQGLRAARTDHHVKAVVVYLQWADFSLAQAEEIRRQIHALTASGKPVECYLETAGEGSNGTLAYYVAAACPRVILAPAGELDIVGFFLDSSFLRGTLDKLEIEPDFEHVGAYKSAGEMFTEERHSDAAREALSSLLDDLYARVVADLATDRKIDEDQVRQLIDGAPYSAGQALELGLVDSLAYPDELSDSLNASLGDDWSWLDLEQYHPPTRSLGTSKVAVAFAQGTIVRGRGGIDPWTQELYIGADTFGATLQELIDDDSITGVILRVDSPGGSAQASDLLLRQVERLAAVKPVVVSMSGLAASGGYYISAKARHIVAEATTLTGSIGVIAGRFITGRFQKDLLGISHDPLQRGANANFYSSVDPLTPQQRGRFVGLMEEVYDKFVGHVASGRGLDQEAVRAVAQGRVWSGQSALGHGLVDELGGFETARDAVAEALGIDVDDTRLVLYPRPPTLFDYLSGQMSPGLLADWLRRALMAELRLPASLEMAPETARLRRPF